VSDQAAVFVHLLPSLIPPRALHGGVALVIDVLRATTVMVQALDAGCEAIIPCLEIPQARDIAASLPDGHVILAGEREGLPIPGFDLGNSPGAFTSAVCKGKMAVMTTTNGTRALHAAMGAERVLVGSFVNLGATVRTLLQEHRPIHLIGSGTNGFVSLEDTLLAGAACAGLESVGRPAGNDEAILARDAWKGVKGLRLAEALGRGRGGRRVREIGLVDDLEFSAQVDRFDLVLEVVLDPLRVVRAC